MSAVLRAAAAYFALAFALGFLLGTLRVLLLVPRLGELASVAVELPLMLTASWFFCRWLLGRFAVPAHPGPRIAMGALAFAMLMAAEVGLSVVLFDRSLGDYAATFASAAGSLGLAGQLAFAAFPALQLRRR